MTKCNSINVYKENMNNDFLYLDKYRLTYLCYSCFSSSSLTAIQINIPYSYKMFFVIKRFYIDNIIIKYSFNGKNYERGIISNIYVKDDKISFTIHKLEINNMEFDVNINNTPDIIDKIQDIRKKNNKCWMDILRLAFKNDPKKAKKIFKKITSNDSEINKLSKELCDE